MKEKTNYGNGVPEKALYLLFGLAVYMLVCHEAFAFGKGHMMAGVHKHLVEHLDWDGEGKLLDIGCGAAALTVRCAKAFPKAQITAMDYWGAEWSYAKDKRDEMREALRMVVVFVAGIFNMYFETNSPVVYVCWSVLSVCLFFKERLFHLGILSFVLMYFTGIMDTFSVMLIQILFIGGAVENGLTWWMEIAYVISFSVYFMIYIILLKKSEVYLNDIEYRYKVAILVQGSIFQMFYNFVFAFFDENHEMYGWDAYVVFCVSIVGAIYAIFLILSLAIKNVLLNRQNNELQSFMHMQKEQYDYQLQQSVTVRRFKHDLTNHIWLYLQPTKHMVYVVRIRSIFLL